MKNMRYRTRRLIKYEDLNANGTLFGGRLTSWIDEEVAIFAICQLETQQVVTKLISEINFMKPGNLNEVVEFGVDVVSFGKTSITLKAIVRVMETKEPIVTIDKMIFVKVDENGKPTPHGMTKRRSS